MKSREDIIKALNVVPLFSELSEEQRRKIAERCVYHTCLKGKIFFNDGDEANGLYILLEGKVKIFRVSPDGREVILHVFGSGELFGEVPVFQGKCFPASAQCVDNGVVLFFPRHELITCIEEDPALALQLLATLSKRLRGFVDKVESLTLMETPQRLAAYLLHTSEENKNSDKVSLDVSKGLLAGMLGTARETLSRCLTKFVEQGIIKTEGRVVHILDKDALKMVVNGVEKL